VYDFVGEGFFDFVTPNQIFNGAWFAGATDTSVSFNLYNQAGAFWANRTASAALALSTWQYVVLQTQAVAVAAPNIYINEVLSNGASTAPTGVKPTPVATDRIFLGTSPSLTQSCPTTTEVAHLAIYDRLITVPEQHDHNLAMIAA